MPEIPNHIFKRAAQITDLFPDVPFMTLANIINADYLAEHSHTVSTIQPEEAKPEQGTPDPRNDSKVASTAKFPDKKPRDRFTPLKRKGRHTRVQITFADGKTFAYPSRKDLIIMNGFSGALYDSVFPHNIKDNEKYLNFEAKSVSELFANANKPIVEYVCYDFENKRRAFKTGEATKESEEQK